MLGPNGAGKTTSISLMLGLRQPTGGQVRLFGLPPTDRRARSRCGVMLQESGTTSVLTVREIVDVFRAYYPAPLPAERAIAMDSTIAESYTALGYGYSLLGELRRAEESFRRAVALDSSVATAWGWYGLLANRLGDFGAAHDRIARARRLEPASLIARQWEAQVYLMERDFPAADSAASTTMALDSTFMLAWQQRENVLLAMGQVAQAVALLERHVAALPWAGHGSERRGAGGAGRPRGGGGAPGRGDRSA